MVWNRVLSEKEHTCSSADFILPDQNCRLMIYLSLKITLSADYYRHKTAKVEAAFSATAP